MELKDLFDGYIRIGEDKSAKEKYKTALPNRTFEEAQKLTSFSGVIKNVGKDGRIKLVNYENGLLSSVQEDVTNHYFNHYDGSPFLKLLKTYDYAEDGTITIGDCIKRQFITINPDKSIKIQ